MADLAAVAETEDWTGNNAYANAILNSYIFYMYERLEMESKIYTSPDNRWAAFNTGLLNHNGDEVFELFTPNANQGFQHWYFTVG